MTLRGKWSVKVFPVTCIGFVFPPAYALPLAKTANLTFRTETQGMEDNGLSVLTSAPFSAACASTHLT